MTEQDVERRLREAFAAQAGAAVSDAAPPPPPRFLTEPAATGPSRRRVRLLAPLAAAAAVVAVVGGILAVTRDSGSSGGPQHVAAGGPTASVLRGSGGAAPAARPNSTAATRAPAGNVHVRLFNADNAQYGVGMPVIAIFSSRITDARPFARATRVSVNGRPIDAAWYFEQSTAGLGAMEAHLRPRDYWPAHAKVHVTLRTEGLSAGRGLAFDDSLTLDFTTGARTVGVVDGRTHVLTVTSEGKRLLKLPVAIGNAKAPTRTGVKVIMEKEPKVSLKGPGYDEVVQHAQRLTYSGEYLYGAAYLNIPKAGGSTNGCTALTPANAARLYDLLQVGDVIEYENTSGAPVSPEDGFGDWNVPWSTWTTGGLLPTK